MADPKPNPAPDSQPETAKPVPAEEASAPKDVQALTPEEQMALYEKDLKENDWGHQPC